MRIVRIGSMLAWAVALAIAVSTIASAEQRRLVCMARVVAASGAEAAVGVCPNGDLQVFNPWTRRELRRVKLPSGTVAMIRVSRDGSRAAAVIDDGAALALIALANGRVTTTPTPEHTFPWSLELAQQGGTLTVEKGGRLYVLDARTGRTLSGPRPAHLFGTERAASRPIDGPTGSPVTVPRCHTPAASEGHAFSLADRRTVIVSLQSAALYACESGRELAFTSLPPGDVVGDILVSSHSLVINRLVSDVEQFTVWDVRSGEARSHAGKAAAISRDGRYVLVPGGISATIFDLGHLGRARCLPDALTCAFDKAIGAYLEDRGAKKTVLAEQLAAPIGRRLLAYYERATGVDLSELDPDLRDLEAARALAAAGRDGDARSALIPLLGSLNPRVVEGSKAELAALRQDGAVAAVGSGALAAATQMRALLAQRRPAEVLRIAGPADITVESGAWRAVRLLRADALVELGRPVEAEQIVAAVLAEGEGDPGSDEVRALAAATRARLFAREGDLLQAEALLAQAAEQTRSVFPANHAQTFAASVALARFQHATLHDERSAFEGITDVVDQLAHEPLPTLSSRGSLRGAVSREAARLAVDICWRLGEPQAPVPPPPAGRSFSPAPLRHASRVVSLAFAPDGRSLFSAGEDGQLIRWDVASGRAMKSVFALGTATVQQLVMDPRGRWIIASNAHEVMRWSDQLALQRERAAAAGPIALSADGDLFMAPQWVGSTTGRVVDADVAGTITPHSRPPDSASPGQAGAAVVDAESFSLVKRPRFSIAPVITAGPKPRVWAVSTQLPDDADGADPWSVCEWSQQDDALQGCSRSAEAEEVVYSKSGRRGVIHRGEFLVMDAAGDGDYEVSAHLVAPVRAHEMALCDGRTVDERSLPLILIDMARQKKVWTGRVNDKSDRGDEDAAVRDCGSLAASPSGKVIAVGGRSGAIRLIDGDTGVVLRTLGGEPPSLAPVGHVRSARFSADGSRVLLETQAELSAWSLPNLVRLTADATKRLAGSPNSAAPAHVISEGQGPGQPIRSPDGANSLSLFPGKVSVQLANSRDRDIVMASSGTPTAAAWSPDGKAVVIGDASGELSIVDSGSGRKIVGWKVHRTGVDRIFCSPDSRWIVSTAYDGSVVLVDVKAKRPAGVFGVSSPPESTG